MAWTRALVHFVGCFAVLGLMASFPTVDAHADHETEGGWAGEGVFLEDVRRPFLGRLLAVPWIEGPMDCAHPAESALRLGEAGVLRVWGNQSHVAVVAEGGGFLALAVESGHGVRTLFMMREHVIAIHDLWAVATSPDEPEGPPRAWKGELGVPMPLEPGGHDMPEAGPEDSMLIRYDGPSGPAAGVCGTGLVVWRHAVPSVLEAGARSRIVVIWDPVIDSPLPGPRTSSVVAEAQVVWARPSDDLKRLQAALDGGREPAELAPVLLLAGLYGAAMVRGYGRRMAE